MTAVLPGIRDEPGDGHDQGDGHGDEAWNRPAVPGWGLWFDLTPPELVNARRVKVVRRWIAAGLVVVVLAIAGAWFLSTMRAGHAGDAVADEQARTSGLQASQRRYAAVTTLTGATAAIDQQLAGLMTDDVDTSAVIGALRSTLPATVRLEQVQLSIDSATAGAAAKTGTAGALESSTDPQVGTVTLSGTAGGVDGVAQYVAALGSTAGFTDVVPTSSSGTDKGFTFSISLNVTDKVLTHRYDLTSATGKAAAGKSAAGRSAAAATPGPTSTTGAAR